MIGTVFTWVLGLGVLFPSLLHDLREVRSTARRTSTCSSARSSGSAPGRPRLAAIVGVGACVAVLAIGRPLLFASIDEAVAAARGVPVRLLGVGFLVLVGVTAAEATQAVGALLLVGLVAAPAGAAQRLTDRPWRGLAIAAGAGRAGGVGGPRRSATSTVRSRRASRSWRSQPVCTSARSAGR